MATWILNFVKSGTPVKKQLGAQARQLFEIGLYGLPPNSQAATKIQIGDRVIAYAGAPERVFLADGVVSQPHHHWTPEQAQQYPLDAGSRLASPSIRSLSGTSPFRSLLCGRRWRRRTRMRRAISCNPPISFAQLTGTN